jgi:O-antigen ligase
MCAVLVLWPRASRPGKLLLGVLLGVFALGIYSTLTPSVWLGAGVALTAIGVLSATGAGRFQVVAAAVAGAAIVAGVSWQQLWTPNRDNELSGKTAAESAELRPNRAVVAWRMFLDRPILGCGLGQYPREVPAYLADRSDELTPEKTRAYAQHNVFLSLLVETGLLGMGLFVALLACWTHSACRLWRAASAPTWARQMALLYLAFMTAYLAGAMFHDLSAIPMVNMFLFFLGGAIMGLTPWLASQQVAISAETWRHREEPELLAV